MTMSADALRSWAAKLNPDLWISRIPLLARALAAAAVLCALILAMVQQRAEILRSGVEMRLATAPVDPRDLFRGDYVVLSYDISLIQPAKLGIANDFKRGEAIYVTLEPGPEGKARVVGASRSPAPAGPGRAMIAGRVQMALFCGPQARGRRCEDEDRAIRVVYGLESYFVPQGEGLAIERTAASRVEVVAAIAPSGKAAIKRLMIDGKALYEEPPY
jgi:uncharacterized membrane-anchored protein